MTIQTSLGRRGFFVSGAAVAGGFSLGFSVPFGPAHAAEVKEINAWVVIQPDDKVVIRIARSEMGQGTLTGLAQLVAEELECDWNKVTWEYPTPGENLKRNRVWKNFSTGGSRGIRESNQYVREGGAMAREMLIAAAAAQWKVPASECSAANSVITHKLGQEAHLRRGCRRGGPARAAQGSEAQGSQGLEDRRQAGEAPRHARQGHRQADLRHRLHDARHAGRDRARLPGDRRQAQELRRRQGREDAGREEGRGDRRQRRRRSWPTPTGTPAPRSPPCRPSGMSASWARSRPRPSRRC